MCGERADEIDHHLATLRAFTPDNLRWQSLSCHQHKTRQDLLLAKFIAACSLDRYGAGRLLRQQAAS